MMPKQSLHQKLLQKLSPQQIKLMKLIQLSTLELEGRIEEELELNPALEDSKLSEKDEVDPYEEKSTEEYGDQELLYDNKEINLDQYISDDEIPAYKLYSNNSPEEEPTRKY